VRQAGKAQKPAMRHNPVRIVLECRNVFFVHQIEDVRADQSVDGVVRNVQIRRPIAARALRAIGECRESGVAKIDHRLADVDSEVVTIARENVFQQSQRQLSSSATEFKHISGIVKLTLIQKQIDSGIFVELMILL